MELEWKEYINDRLIAHHESGFYVIKPKETNESEHPLFCPVCEAIMQSSYDDEAHKKYQCCDSCANRWVYRDIERWKSGWRPNPDEVQNNCSVSHI